MTHYTTHAPGRMVRVKGGEFLYFGGTSYLGLQADTEFQALMLNCLKIYGSSHGASRISNLRLDIYEQAETQLAAWVGSEAALTLSSGFLAGQLLSYLFDGNEFRHYYTPGTHPSVIRGKMQSFISFDELEAAVGEGLSENGVVTPVIFLDSVDLAGGNYPSFSLLKRLPLDKVIVVADDSHGLGILGDNGGGTYSMLSALHPKELLVCSSLGKALGVQGGVIFGSGKRLREIWDTPFFSGASPAPPGHIAALMRASHSLYHERRRQLEHNIGLFEKVFPHINRFRKLPHYPVFAFNNPDLTSYLETRGILVTDFPYAASPTGSFHGRIVLSAHHMEDDILRLARELDVFHAGHLK